MTCVKFCGITRARDIQSINALHRRYPKTPLYVGFVFYAPSKRAISASQALQLKGLLAPDISTVGVFVNEPPAAVASLLNSGVINYAQWHAQAAHRWFCWMPAGVKARVSTGVCWAIRALLRRRMRRMMRLPTGIMFCSARTCLQADCRPKMCF